MLKRLPLAVPFAICDDFGNAMGRDGGARGKVGRPFDWLMAQSIGLSYTGTRLTGLAAEN